MKLRFANTSENTKKQLYKIYKLCYILISNLRHRELESHTLPSRPSRPNNRQTLVTNKTATYAY